MNNFPVKGNIITMNIDGSDKEYRILKVLGGTTVEVVCMSNSNVLSFNKFLSSGNRYSSSVLDKYLNIDYYNSLTPDAKNALIQKEFRQDCWNWYTEFKTRHRVWKSAKHVETVYSGMEGDEKPGIYMYHICSDNTIRRHKISRYVYALSVQDVLDYVKDTSVGDGELQNYNIWNMFWNDEVSHHGTDNCIWLRSSFSEVRKNSWYINGWSGFIGNFGMIQDFGVRPAFQINLSKIDWSFTN